MNWKALLLIPLLLFFSLNAGAEYQGRGDIADILTVVKDGRGEVLEGTLHCAACRVDYPIHEGIPNLLPPQGP